SRRGATAAVPRRRAKRVEIRRIFMSLVSACLHRSASGFPNAQGAQNVTPLLRLDIEPLADSACAHRPGEEDRRWVVNECLLQTANRLTVCGFVSGVSNAIKRHIGRGCSKMSPIN